jgi:hypothetical protein
MKTLSLVVAAALMTAGAAYAQDTTVIHRDGPVGSSTTVRHDDGVTGTTVEKRTTSSDVGCSSKSVTRTNDDGDKVTKTRTDC